MSFRLHGSYRQRANILWDRVGSATAVAVRRAGGTCIQGVNSMRRIFTLFRVLCVLAFSGCGGGGSGGGSGNSTLTQADALAQFDSLWSAFDQNYSYFDHKKVDWNAAKSSFRPRASQALDQATLNQVFNDMLATLHDQHVRLIAPSGTQIPTYEPKPFVNWKQDVWVEFLKKYSTLSVQVKPELLVANLQGIAYLMIGAWDSSQFGVSDIDTAISQAQSFPALIVDVRPNAGGDSGLAFALAQRFITGPVITGYYQTKNGSGHSDFSAAVPNTILPRGPWQYTKPVILLVGKGTLSSSESFVSAMRELPNVTVVGDATGGSSGNPKTYSLTSGWSYTVSSWIEYTAKSEVIEDKGIQPQVLVPSNEADFAVGLDPVFEWAITKAKSLK